MLIAKNRTRLRYITPKWCAKRRLIISISRLFAFRLCGRDRDGRNDYKLGNPWHEQRTRKMVPTVYDWIAIFPSHVSHQFACTCVSTFSFRICTYRYCSLSSNSHRNLILKPNIHSKRWRGVFSHNQPATFIISKLNASNRIHLNLNCRHLNLLPLVSSPFHSIFLSATLQIILWNVKN